MKSLSVRFALLVLAALTAGWGLTGCGTIESDNQASTPWNQPKGWQQSPINVDQYQR